MAFKFKFESILSLKTRLEDMKKAEFKEASERLEQEKEELKRLTELKNVQYDFMKNKEENGFTAKDLIAFTNYINNLKERIEKQKQAVMRAADRLEVLRQELIKISQEKKMFETLKEKKLDEYMQEYYKQEQQVVDDIVNFKYSEANS